MVEMRMRDHNGIKHPVAQSSKVWQGIFAFLLRVHAAVQDEPLTSRLQVVAIGADFSAAREINKLQISILVLTRALALSSICLALRCAPYYLVAISRDFGFQGA